ncbi:hypothetical protein BD410DRAFT_845727 [Rickenella mellea]|uniref:Uncharacterized protein n=1 Tax=Rickenella mellea TaxID=50990 RepID=A0A4Y7PI70_9AGAM|nr:hypothetical protein BD410DRAFT_845727 [Rickenella mellea]
MICWRRGRSYLTLPDPPSRSAKCPGPGPRLTEIYDNYIGGYEDEAPTTPDCITVATTERALSARAPSAYGGSSTGIVRNEEEAEGYFSGEYEDGPFELVKIRLKLHYDDGFRGMTLTPETPFDEFLERDEDGGKISLRDDFDYEASSLN